MSDQVILFSDANFHGDHRHVFDSEADLSADRFNDVVSSLVVLSGNWSFFRDSKFGNPYPVVLGPGMYSFVEDFQIKNDDISSLQTTADAPTMLGEPLDAHAVLFRDANFKGDHRHVFVAEPNLDNNGFNDQTSSIVIELGNWMFFRDSEFDGHYPPVLGPGIYPWVEAIGVKNDDLSSLRPTDSSATVGNAVDNEVLLFVDAGFRGDHRHVFEPEPDLNDLGFNDVVSSLAVLNGTWQFYQDANFIAPYQALLPPGAYSFVVNQGIRNDDISSLRPAIEETVTLGTSVLGHAILFENANFHGAHRHIFNGESDLSSIGFNDVVSSVVILSGNWASFRNANFDDDYPSILGPGLYPWVENVNIRNDDMSSLMVVDQPPNVQGQALGPHLVLFEHRDFRGAHKHVFAAEPNLNASDDNSFNDVASSIVVIAGTWATFADAAFRRQYRPLIGPGLYAWVEDIGIKNDDMSSLQPINGSPTIAAPAAQSAHVILFKDAGLHGDHKHIFEDEPNLNAADDNSFNDAVSSLVVLQENWRLFRDAQFKREYPPVLGPGIFRWVVDFGITNDDLSSLELAGTVVTFAGTVTFQLDDQRVPKPITKNVAFTLLFFSTSRLVKILGFPDVLLASLSNDTVTSEFQGADNGTLPSDGALQIPNAHFKIHHSNSLASDSDAPMSFSTATATSPGGKFTVTGSPADGMGNIVIVGAGQLQGGYLGGEQFAVTLRGLLSPWPL